MTFTIKDLENKIKEIQNVNFQFDSRKVKKNSVFFALQGEKVDGQSFL